MRTRPDIAQVLKETSGSILAPLTLVVWAAAGVIGAVAGPFGTFEAMPFPVRAFFWFMIASASVLMGYGARALAMITVGPDRPVRFDIIATLSMTICFIPVVLVVGKVVEARTGVPMPSVPEVGLYILVIAAPIFVLRRMIPGFESRRYAFLEAQEEEAAAGQPRLMRRLPAELRGDLIRLSGSGHHTQVVTTRGTTTLRLRLSDAIEETDPVPGHAIHRSHWVAEAAIRDIRRETPHKLVMVLHNQDTVPVSRSYRPQLEDAGLIG